MSKQVITEARKTPERAWLGEVSAVVLQQSLRDLEAAYGNFFASKNGARRGPAMGPPKMKKKAARQAVRFTANARWSITDGGKLRLPKIGDIDVAWSRVLPSEPSSVTIIKDPSGRYFVSFVVEVDDKPLRARVVREPDGTTYRGAGQACAAAAASAAAARSSPSRCDRLAYQPVHRARAPSTP
ncbi:RNA-guided endonuclease InsQ/TnpB family protein [Streptomyces sp. NPDC007917]|uniref:RNA-guided endonuclease InsQ/TnpB family protein n=1 Tax=Streptomyces sp. NPDC007917 TaxID=3364793 RepID=UPI0036E03538